MTAPQTPSGRRYIDQLWDDPGTPVRATRAAEEAVPAIEREAAEQERSRIAAAVRDLTHHPKCLCGPEPSPTVSLAEVLALIEGVEPSPPSDGWMYCGLDGCAFAVEVGEGRTMALHQSDEDHEPWHRALIEGVEPSPLPDYSIEDAAMAECDHDGTISIMCVDCGALLLDARVVQGTPLSWGVEPSPREPQP